VIRWYDVVDVLVVAAVFGVMLSWLRQARARLALLGLLILGVVYLVARRLDLQLTLWIFSGFFAAFVIVIVVVFQEELRRIFEQIALWGLQWKKPPPAAGLADILTRAVRLLAERNSGALLVLPGREPLDRHTTGGIELDGRLSAPLVLSLFDKNSPGHDGAAVIASGFVQRFAVHLPLSSEPLGDFGTRHAAALGLAERTDALCIVVSEERGTVSVARSGRLRTLPNPAAVTEEIHRFQQEVVPEDQNVQALPRAAGRWKEMAGGLVLAVVLWMLLVAGRTFVESTVNMPVHVEPLPAGHSVQVDPESLRVTVRARRGDLLLVRRDALRVLIDGRTLVAGRQARALTAQDVSVPEGLTVVAVDPESVWTTLTPPAQDEE
jgi:uncharacterized protein (TIGR00159 family)